MKLLSLLVCAFLFISCNNTATSSAKDKKTRTDSLMDEVMEGHNIGMAKMSKINQAKKNIQRVLDSISKLPANLQKSSARYKMQLDSTFKKLTFAANAMDKWMEEFDMDSAKTNEQKRTEYLESEKIKINNVREAIIGSLQRADSLLKLKR